MRLVGSRVIIRPLELKDVYEMKNWGFHKNPLLDDYNFPDMVDSQIKKWYKYKTNSFFNRYYGILNKDYRLIGYLGIKNIKFVRRESTLGLVLDPNYINKGYGTEALWEYLNYYFNQLKMKKMDLEVAEFNQRALKVYEKVGFRSIEYYLDEFHNQKLDLNDNYYLDNKSCFVLYNKRIYNYIYKMRLDKDVFNKGL